MLASLTTWVHYMKIHMLEGDRQLLHVVFWYLCTPCYKYLHKQRYIQNRWIKTSFSCRDLSLWLVFSQGCVCVCVCCVLYVSRSCEWAYFPDSFLSIGIYEGDWALHVNFVYWHFSKLITSKRFPVESLRDSYVKS